MTLTQEKGARHESPNLRAARCGHNWPTIEKKSKIRSGSTLSGQFTTDITLGDFVSVRFNFNREFLSDGVDYTLTFHKQ